MYFARRAERRDEATEVCEVDAREEEQFWRSIGKEIVRQKGSGEGEGEEEIRQETLKRS